MEPFERRSDGVRQWAEGQALANSFLAIGRQVSDFLPLGRSPNRKLIDHLLIFEGQGMVKDFNGSYSEFRMDQLERERMLKDKSVKPLEKNVEADKPAKKKFSYKEKS